MNFEYNDLPESKGQLVPLTAIEIFEHRPHLPAVVESLHQTSFALEAMRRYFMEQRRLDGAGSNLGHRWSNLIEQTWNLHFAELQSQRENLMCAIALTTLQIRNIRRGESPKILMSPQQLLLTFRELH